MYINTHEKISLLYIPCKIHPILVNFNHQYFYFYIEILQLFIFWTNWNHFVESLFKNNSKITEVTYELLTQDRKTFQTHRKPLISICLKEPLLFPHVESNMNFITLVSHSQTNHFHLCILTNHNLQKKHPNQMWFWTATEKNLFYFLSTTFFFTLIIFKKFCLIKVTPRICMKYSTIVSFFLIMACISCVLTLKLFYVIQKEFKHTEFKHVPFKGEGENFQQQSL